MYNHIPDLCLLGLGAAAVASAWLWPWTVVLPGWLRLVGGALIVAAALVIGAVLGALRRAATSTNPVDEPTALLASGPFGLSRNPLYLAYVLAVLGCALALHGLYSGAHGFHPGAHLLQLRAHGCQRA